MKFLVLLGCSFFLTGCLFGTSNEIKKSEQIIKRFHCDNIEQQGSANPISSYHQQTLNISKQKSEDYLQQYKDGDRLFNVPLDEVINQQYSIYKDACQSLGGIL
ncbi:hypothetical protein [Acinetobacter sp. MD2(2019)]|uniref:hypothetical protein n=1 Tax=Acinetobacter sp. MD2(2019) TaxID=2605273 RepID=UPI002D1E5966|nr:hypothetical protein [Acinetobacter sp. MD2(2019)]MEB3753991.1 hypothetical protein [Acinetobacter sp. MD2(2019)]